MMQKNDEKLIIFEDIMRKKDLRLTATRRDIFKVLLNSGQPLTKQQIVRQIPDSHFVSVYRSIDVLHRNDIIKQVPHGFKVLYELQEDFLPHHHHATCEICGKSIEVHDERVEELMRDITIKSGLKPTKHFFEMYGICRKCSHHDHGNQTVSNPL